jgi:phosphoribosylformylglycinamidine (FGAM) synthase-like amidotransferase family enzyme
MPHPERAMEFVLGSEDGVRMLKGFENAWEPQGYFRSYC